MRAAGCHGVLASLFIAFLRRGAYVRRPLLLTRAAATIAAHTLLRVCLRRD
jgi:hypothetical protein